MREPAMTNKHKSYSALTHFSLIRPVILIWPASCQNGKIQKTLNYFQEGRSTRAASYFVKRDLVHFLAASSDTTFLNILILSLYFT